MSTENESNLVDRALQAALEGPHNQLCDGCTDPRRQQMIDAITRTNARIHEDLVEGLNEADAGIYSTPTFTKEDARVLFAQEFITFFMRAYCPRADADANTLTLEIYADRPCMATTRQELAQRNSNG